MFKKYIYYYTQYFFRRCYVDKPLMQYKPRTICLVHAADKFILLSIIAEKWIVKLLKTSETFILVT